MIYSLTTVEVVHGKMNEYTDLVAKELMPIYQRLGIKLIGSWHSGVGGDNDENLVLFAWDNMAQMEKLTAVRAADKEWIKVYPKYMALTARTSSKIFLPNAYSSIK
jgi:hypothetical protein